MKRKFATPSLIACVLFLGFVTGTGIYQHMFWLPAMFKSPLILTESLSGVGDEPQKFWIPLHALVFVTLICSLVFNWQFISRKRLILWALIGYIYISLISIYFAKKLFAFKELNDSVEFVQQAKQWLVLSWHRPILMAVIELLLLIAISKYTDSPNTN